MANNYKQRKEEGWSCNGCGVSGFVPRALLNIPGGVGSTGSCIFTRGCRGVINPVREGTLTIGKNTGNLITAGNRLVWRIVVPAGRGNRYVEYDRGEIFNHEIGRGEDTAPSLDDLSISVFLPTGTGGERRVLEGVDGTFVAGGSRVRLALKEGTLGSFAGGAVIVIARRGDRESVDRIRTLSAVDNGGTDERSISVRGGRIAVCVDSTVGGDSVSDLEVVVRYSERSDSEILEYSLELRSTTDPVIADDLGYAVDTLSRVTVQTSRLSARVYNVYSGTLLGTPLIERGVVIRGIVSCTVNGISVPNLVSDPAVAWILLPRVDEVTSIISGSDSVRIEVLDDIDPVYGVPLSRVRGNVVSDGSILRGIVVQPRVVAGDSLTLSLLAVEPSPGGKLVARIGSVDWPSEFIFS